MSPQLFEKLNHFVNAASHKHQFNSLHFIILLLSIIAFYIKLRSGYKKLFKLPPSPPTLPVIGNLHQLSTLPHHSLAALSKKYGPLLLLKLGKVPTLVISSADMAQEMMKTHDIVFSNRPQTIAAKIFFYDCADFGFAPYGNFWRQVRKICVLELFSHGRVRSFQYVREKEVQVLFKRLQTAFVEGLPVNLSALLMSTSNNIISRCILGKKFEDENGESKYGKLGRKLLEQFTAFCFTDFFPSLSWIDLVRGYNKRLKKIFEEFDELIDQLVEEHKVKSYSQDVQSDRETDLMDVLLQLQKDGNLGFELTNVNVKAIILDLLVAGTDTTSTSLEWTMAELIRNPTKMKKAQEEIREVVGKKTRIDPKNLEEMNYLDCVIKESLRLHPPVPLSVPRETSFGVENMGGYNIPPKTMVFLNLYAIHRDPDLWENPNHFIPERFLDSSVDFKGQENFQYLPFGGGRRGCPGLTFGLTSVKNVMANLLYWFDWKLSDENLVAEELDMDECPGLAVGKKVPLHLKPIIYSP